MVTPLVGIDTLPDFKSGDFPTLGPAIVAWAMQRDMKVLHGKKSGERFVPTKSQYKFICHWYRLRDDGEFYYRGGAVRLARGSLKSPLGGWFATVELVGPVRFAGWDKFDKFGNLLGKRQSMPLVQIAAVSEAQTDNTFKYIGGWNAKGTKLQLEFNLDPGKTQIISPGAPGVAGGKTMIMTSSSATARGASPSLVIADEVSEWVHSNGGQKLWDTIRDNASKVDGARVLGLMNTWSPGSGSVAEDLYDDWVAEQAGDVVAERPLLYWSREASPETDWSDAESIASTLAYIYEECPWINQGQILSTILSPSKSITSSMREYGNLIVSDLSSWASKQDWDANRVDDRLVDGDEIVLALDPAISEDCTVLMGCRLSDGLAQPLFSWNPQVRHADLNVADLDAAVAKAFATYKVRAFGADVHPLEGRVMVDWAEKYADELWIEASNKGVIAFDMRQYKKEFAQAAELTADDIINRNCPHVGDSLLNQHVVNAQRRPYLEFVSVGRGNREKKIDGAISLVLARLMRRKLLESPEYEKRSRQKKVIVFRR